MELARTGKNDLAMEAFARLAEQWPQRPEPRVNLAVLQARRGDLPQARATLEQALRSDPTYATVFAQWQRLTAELARQAYARADLLPTAAPASDSLNPLPLELVDMPMPPAPAAPHAPAEPAAAVASSGSSASDTTASPLEPASALPQASASLEPGPGGSTGQGGRHLGWILTGALLAVVAVGGAWAARRPAGTMNPTPDTQPQATLREEPLQPTPAAPEERLIGIYRDIGKGRLDLALPRAQELARDLPNFQLVQQLHGDLLLATAGLLDAPATPASAAGLPVSVESAQRLRSQALTRLEALRSPPPPGTVPRQLLDLPPDVTLAVAVDTSRSRLYLLERSGAGRLQVRSSHYVSLGSLGTGKRSEGDQRTPLGVYWITSRLEGKQVGDFYGPGALPINFPNEHDRRLGRTGANIWLHGTPSREYARAPRSTNGCVVLANDDMRMLLRELQPRRTPVLIARHIDWVAAQSLGSDRQFVRELLGKWQSLRAQGDLRRLAGLYARQFDNGEVNLTGWLQKLSREASDGRLTRRQVGEPTVLSWQEQGDALFVEFPEIDSTQPGRSLRRRQYWAHDSGQWKIFSEGVSE